MADWIFGTCAPGRATANRPLPDYHATPLQAIARASATARGRMPAHHGNELGPGRVTTSRSVECLSSFQVCFSGQLAAHRTAVLVDRADVLPECGQVERVSGDYDHVGALAGG